MMTSGACETTRVLPALSRMLNNTRVPAPKLVPTSSITWPTLAAGSPALAATPAPALALIWLSVADSTATGSTAVLMRYTSPWVDATHSVPSAANDRPEISLWLMFWLRVSIRRSSVSTPAAPTRYSTSCAPPLIAPSHRWPVVGSTASPDQLWMLNGAVITPTCAPVVALSSMMRLPGPLFSVR